jgi:GNAT superfamily N-acetyltransferase
MTKRSTKTREQAPAESSAPVEPAVPEEIVRAAMQEPGLRGRVFLCSKRREPFVSPHQTKMGWRHGPIFLLPGYRGRGLVEAYYAAHPERHCVAFIPDSNRSSRRMHEKAGFKDKRRGAGGWFMERAALEAASQ